MIKVSNLRKEYPNPEGHLVALNGVDFDINDGEIFGIIGKSGAGKTTLLRIMSQLEAPNDGEVIIDDVVIATKNKVNNVKEIKQKIGIVFQGYNLLMQKNVAGNIAFPLKILGKRKEEIDPIVDELLELVGLKDKKNVYPSHLSGGQKQRVAIARALASSPSLLLLDEPTSALDSLTTKQIIELLRKINKERKVTILIITHEIGIVRQLCDRVGVMDLGSIVDYGRVEEVFKNPTNSTTKQLIGLKEEE